MKTIIVMAVLACAGCSDEQNLGDRPVLHAARWTVAAGSPDGNSSARLVAIDGAGDVVAAGSFQGTVNFGRTTLTGSAQSTGQSTSWIGKRSGIDGSERWTVPLANDGLGITALAVTPQRDTIVVGRYSGNQDFGGQRLITITPDTFVAKYDPDGVLLWVTGLDPRSQSEAIGVAVAPDGQIYLSARFTGSIALPDRLISGGPYVVAALGADGHVLWGRQLPVGGKVQVTSDGSAVVAGVVTSSMTVGTTMIDLTRDPDLFVAKLDHDGALVSVRSFGIFGQDDQDVTWSVGAEDRIAADANGHDYQAGVPHEMLLDYMGAPVWSTSVASGAGRAVAIAATADGVITSGVITSPSIDLGDGVRVGSMYLTARDETGALTDARVFGDPSLGPDEITSLAVGPSGELGFAGYITQPIDLGSGRLVPPGGAQRMSVVIGVLPP